MLELDCCRDEAGEEGEFPCDLLTEESEVESLASGRMRGARTGFEFDCFGVSSNRPCDRSTCRFVSSSNSSTNAEVRRSMVGRLSFGTSNPPFSFVSCRTSTASEIPGAIVVQLDRLGCRESCREGSEEGGESRGSRPETYY